MVIPIKKQGKIMVIPAIFGEGKKIVQPVGWTIEVCILRDSNPRPAD